MNKKSIIYFGIVLISAILIAGGFWAWKGDQEIDVAKEQNQIQQQTSNINIDQSNNNPDMQTVPEDQLVWYKVPELGIEFKVTPDTMSDLKYFIKEHNETGEITASFYSESVKDFIEKYGKLKRSFPDSCVDHTISKIDKKYINKNPNDTPLCRENDIILDNNNYLFCLNSAQSIVFDSKEQLFKWEELTKDKKFGNFFNTVMVSN